MSLISIARDLGPDAGSVLLSGARLGEQVADLGAALDRQREQDYEPLAAVN